MNKPRLYKLALIVADKKKLKTKRLESSIQAARDIFGDRDTTDAIFGYMLSKLPMLLNSNAIPSYLFDVRGHKYVKPSAINLIMQSKIFANKSELEKTRIKNNLSSLFTLKPVSIPTNLTEDDRAKMEKKRAIYGYLAARNTALMRNYLNTLKTNVIIQQLASKTAARRAKELLKKLVALSPENQLKLRERQNKYLETKLLLQSKKELTPELLAWSNTYDINAAARRTLNTLFQMERPTTNDPTDWLKFNQTFNNRFPTNMYKNLLIPESTSWVPFLLKDIPAEDSLYWR